MKNTQTEVKNFINTTIKLDRDRYQKMKNRFSEVKETLEKELTDSANIVIQGSVATKTSIRPRNEDHEYDLDIAVVFNRQLSPNEFISLKNKIYSILFTTYGSKVTKKSKCLNIKFNNEFNIDVIVMSNFNSKQEIFNEQSFSITTSNNLNWISEINTTFKVASDDVYRDAVFLLKFYTRQFRETEGKIPSIALTGLVASNISRQSSYEANLLTTLSNVASKLNTLSSSNTAWPLTIPFKHGKINTKISSSLDLKKLILVINEIRNQLMVSGLKKIAYGSQLENKQPASSLTEKPWMMK